MPRPALTRRTLLTTLGAGVAGGLALAWQARGDRAPEPGANRPIQVHGGTEFGGARSSALRVWTERPRVRSRGLTATYVNAGESSDIQLAGIQNLLNRAPEYADLLIVDAEHLPGLVAAGQVVPFADLDRTWLVEDLGCIGRIADRCVVGDEVCALPLNTDFPLLAFNTARFGDPGVLDTLRTLTGAEFWTTALDLVTRANGPAGTRRILLQTGPYEGFTACLTELVAAFGTLDPIKRIFPRGTFDLGGGTEKTTFDALEEDRAVAARLWPSQCRDLTRHLPAAEAGAAIYEFVPIPGGVLGGQVIAVGKRSPLADSARELAVHLAGAASQWQLNYNAGYVPTIAEMYADEQLRTELYGIDDGHLDACTLRPQRADYEDWSSRFREETRNRLS
ncbi:hypothetical protein [Paractinoplanes rishiriensis]|uniref:Extracellular solute-binding protein n=1 Tax=Paractinoplanes rishiriensis TaxID=1050105 RepID=A0A919N2S5_9ACTN|nr:hypothetical protein [Actinoplanes rishiriensis]GIF01663.1 hypothetical protein Ari01nite_91270 [Actinoplanes rishiriensis]